MRTETHQHGNVSNLSNHVQIQGLDDARELSLSSSTISIDFDDFPRTIIDHLDTIYTHHSHQQCIHLTYLTLLSMTCSVIFWMIYWLTYDYCDQLLIVDITLYNCTFTFLFQILTWISLCLTPLLFLLMIIFWTKFSCKNPIDPIRQNFIGFRLDGDQWKNQLDSYYKTKTNCFTICSYRKRNQLIERNFGYIILSSYGIIFDELFIYSSKKNIFLSGTLLDNGQILKLEFQNFSKNPLLIYLPNEIINYEILQELNRILKINISPIRF